MGIVDFFASFLIIRAITSDISSSKMMFEEYLFKKIRPLSG